MLKHALLALLVEKSRHGYDLKTEFEKAMGGLWPAVNIGQIYTTLSRLERDGLVASRRIAQDDRPDKLEYELSPAGRQELQAWLAQPVETVHIKDEFFVKLAFGHLAGMDVRQLISHQRSAYIQAIRALEALAASNTGNGPVTRLLIEGAVLQVEANLKWLDACEEQLK